MSRVASNFKYLDKDKDKDLIAQMSKEHQEELKKVDYAIDLDKNIVKKTIHYAIYITNDKNKDILHTDKVLNKDLRDMYLINMETFNKGLDTYKDLDNYNVIMFDAKKHKKQLDKIKYEEQEQYILDNFTSKIDNIDALNIIVKQFNEFYDFHYLQGFSLKVKDLLNDDIKKEFIKNYATAYKQVQVSDIEKIGIKEWLNSDLDTIQDFNFNLDKDILKDIQIKINNYISDENISDEIIISKKLDDLIYDANLKRFTNEVDTYINDDKEYYKKAHRLYQEIDKKIIDIVNWFKDKSDELNNNGIVVSKNKITKLPKSICYDFDIVKFFSNVYPNYKYKSIDDDRHKRYDYKAQLILDIDIENPKTMEEIRLSNFLSYCNDIQLHPIQYTIINSAIDIRDLNGADTITPLLSIIKYYREDKNMRLPTNKKDLQLYEDFMLFFNYCKVSFYIKDRQTGEMIIDPTPPIALLENDAISGKKYGYWIGRSALNFFKEQYDALEGIDTPRITTHQTSKKYLNYSRSKNLVMDNVVQFIYPRITQMINSYKKNKKYQPKINISYLYNFMILYKRDKYNKLKTQVIDKSDKNDVKEYVKSYLNDLKAKELIKDYTNDKDIFKIEINKNAKI